MNCDSEKTAPAAALDILDTFASVGAESFHLTLTDLKGNKVGFRKSVPLSSLRQDIRGLLERASLQQHNVIVRPHSARAVFIQLDDLDVSAMERLKPAAFLGLKTSPGNYQAWIAMAENPEDDFP